MSEPREFDFVPLKRAARHLVGKPKAELRFRRQKHVDTITVFVDSDFTADPLSRKSTTGLVPQIGIHTEIWIHASELDSLGRWRGEVLRSGECRSSWTILKFEAQNNSSTANSLTTRLGGNGTVNEAH